MSMEVGEVRKSDGLYSGGGRRGVVLGAGEEGGSGEVGERMVQIIEALFSEVAQ